MGGEGNYHKIYYNKVLMMNDPIQISTTAQIWKNESSQTNCQKYGQQGSSTLMILSPYKIPSLSKFWGKEILADFY